MSQPKVPRPIPRRSVNALLGGGVLLWGCGGEGSSVGGSGGSAGSASGGAGGAGGSGGASTGGVVSGSGGGAGAAGSSAGSAGAGPGIPWATGGTMNMTGSYPDPFPTTVASCELAGAATEGPCIEAADRVRRDISEGYPGLPVRLALLIVDSSCTPIEGAKVKIWHTQVSGSYSGDTPANDFCLLDPAENTKHYFRGVQNSNASGRVDFDTCFPGWYPGRAIHIHYTVTAGDNAFTSQLGFEQALIDDVFARHPDYQPHGMPNTTNAGDGILAAIGLSGYLLATELQSDGALLASKVIVVPS